jgi:3-phosphoshikimate 1-carboxyvinyltransferase
MLKIIAPSVFEVNEVEIPFSKSISTRLAILNKLSDGKISYDFMSDVDDAARLVRILERIENCSISSIPSVIDAGNSGAVMRFLAAFLAILPGKWLLTGSKRLKERPIGDLVESLRMLGAHIEYKEKESFCPVLINGKKLKGGRVKINVSKSSQFASALLLIANEFEQGLTMELVGKPTSLPYLDMSVDLMKLSGLEIRREQSIIQINPGLYHKVRLENEKDWSAASFWYMFFLFSKESRFLIKGLKDSKLQGDAILPRLFAELGIQTTFVDEGVMLHKSESSDALISFDFVNHIDLAVPVILSAAVKGFKADFTGLGNLKIKESDRFGALIEVLNRMQPTFKTDKLDSIQLKGGNPVYPGKLNCFNDHRLIMAYSSLAMCFGQIVLSDFQQIEKSYPSYFKELENLGFELKAFDLDPKN